MLDHAAMVSTFCIYSRTGKIFQWIFPCIIQRVGLSTWKWNSLSLVFDSRNFEQGKKCQEESPAFGWVMIQIFLIIGNSINLNLWLFAIIKSSVQIIMFFMVVKHRKASILIKGAQNTKYFGIYMDINH